MNPFSSFPSSESTTPPCPGLPRPHLRRKKKKPLVDRRGALELRDATVPSSVAAACIPISDRVLGRRHLGRTLWRTQNAVWVPEPSLYLTIRTVPVVITCTVPCKVRVHCDGLTTEDVSAKNKPCHVGDEGLAGRAYQLSVGEEGGELLNARVVQLEM